MSDSTILIFGMVVCGACLAATLSLLIGPSMKQPVETKTEDKTG